MFSPNQQIGPYTLIRKLGQGGFKVVWLAERRGDILTTQVAIGLPIDPDQNLNAIRQEAQSWLAASGHANVLPVIEAHVYDGQVVIVSEYAPGGSLSALLKQYGGKAPSEQAAVALASGILSGLEHLHNRRIVHRDLKPANVLLQGGTPRLTDFGISRVLRATAYTQNVAGTPAYMAPETFDGHYSAQSDMWAVGVMLYEMLTGRLPYPQTDIFPLMAAIQSRDPDPLPPSFPASLQRVVTKALQKDPQQRYASAAAMRAALVEQPPFPVPVPLPPSSPPSVSAPTLSENATAPIISRRRAVTLIGVGSVACVSIVGAIVGGGMIVSEVMSRSGKDHDPLHSLPKPHDPTPTNPTPPFVPSDRTKINPEDGAEMIWIPAGEFLMGDDDQSNNPRHTVNLDGYYIYKNDVTVGMYKAFCQATGHQMPPEPEYPAGNHFNPNWSKDDHPIVNVSWDDAKAYCDWAGVSLPTEAQWEKAARGTDGRKYPWGNTYDGSRLQHSPSTLGDARGTAPVGSFPSGASPYGVLDMEGSVCQDAARGTAPVGSFPSGASPYGVLDMAGNVDQWCADWYDANYCKSSPNTNPTGPGSGIRRVVRGGSWNISNPVLFRAAYRVWDEPTDRGDYDGFRGASRL